MKRDKQAPDIGAFLLASVLHFYSGRPLQNLSGVDTGGGKKEKTTNLASFAECSKGRPRGVQMAQTGRIPSPKKKAARSRLSIKFRAGRLPARTSRLASVNSRHPNSERQLAKSNRDRLHRSHIAE